MDVRLLLLYPPSSPLSNGGRRVCQRHCDLESSIAFSCPSLQRWIRVAVRRDAASDYEFGCVPADVLIDRRLPADCTPRLRPRGRFTNLTRHVLHRVMGPFGASLFAILHHHRYLNHHPRGSSIPIALFDPSYLGISRLLT